MKQTDYTKSPLLKTLALLVIFFIGPCLTTSYAARGDDIDRAMSDAKEVARDIRSVVGDFNHHYTRANDAMKRSSSVHQSYYRSVSSSYDKFMNVLRGYKPDSVQWGQKNIMDYHRVNIKSAASVEGFAEFSDDVLDDLRAEMRNMQDLSVKIESAVYTNTQTTKVYKTYHYTQPTYYRTTPYYYRSTYYRPYYKHHNNYRYNYGKHGRYGRHGGGSIGFHFRIK